jgi:hypothetical protein
MLLVFRLRPPQQLMRLTEHQVLDASAMQNIVRMMLL